MFGRTKKKYLRKISECELRMQKQQKRILELLAQNEALKQSLLSMQKKEKKYADAKASAKKAGKSAKPEFNPKAKIRKYIENETKFNMDDVLNPKENLDLEELCKELGLMDEAESKKEKVTSKK